MKLLINLLGLSSLRSLNYICACSTAPALLTIVIPTAAILCADVLQYVDAILTFLSKCDRSCNKQATTNKLTTNNKNASSVSVILSRLYLPHSLSNKHSNIVVQCEERRTLLPNLVSIDILSHADFIKFCSPTVAKTWTSSPKL